MEKPTSPLKKPLFFGLCIPLLLAAIAFLVYVPSLQLDFVYDARTEILEEGFINFTSNLPAVLSLKVLGMNLMLGDRPGQLLYLMFHAAVWGKQPWGYHLSSNLLHAINVALLFVLLRRLVVSEAKHNLNDGRQTITIALVAVTLLFALHPIVTEAVAAINFSSDLLVACFTLLALLAACAFRPDNLWLAVSMGLVATLCALASVTCKESGLATALLLLAYWFLFRRSEAKGPWTLFLAGPALVTGVFLAARFYFAPASQQHLSYLGGSFFSVLLNQPRLWVLMMGQLLWPTHLSADYTLENVSRLTTPVAWLVLAIVLSLQFWLAARSRLGALGVAIYWLGLLTVSNFVPLYRIVADRYYYLPLTGVALQFLALLIFTLKWRTCFCLAITTLVIALVPLTFLTINRERVFANDVSLWSDTLRVSPDSWLAEGNLATALAREGLVDEAMIHFQKALRANPNFAQAHGNLGNALYEKGQIDQAIVHYEKAIEINPYYAEAHSNLGNALSTKGRIDEAMVQYQKALEINPSYAEIHYNLGSIFAQKGELNEAMDEYQKAIVLNSNFVEAQEDLGVVLSQKGQFDQAIAHFQKALQIRPNDAEIHGNLGIALYQKGQIDDAISEYGRALELDPKFVEAHTNLGIALCQKGELEEAVAQFKDVVQLNPNDPQAQQNLAKVEAAALKAQRSR